MHEGGAHLWPVGVASKLPHPIEAELGGVGGAVVGGLTQVGGLGRDGEPPAGLQAAVQISQSEQSTAVHSKKEETDGRRMSGAVEQAGSGESARKEEEEKCDQPIRRQQCSVHDGMHRVREAPIFRPPATSVHPRITPAAWLLM